MASGGATADVGGRGGRGGDVEGGAAWTGGRRGGEEGALVPRETLGSRNRETGLEPMMKAEAAHVFTGRASC